MRNVMKKAWEIARKGQKKFGGKVSEYLAEALRVAWSLVKKGMELAKLNGTERQVKWAESIRKDLLELLENVYKTVTKNDFKKIVGYKVENGEWIANEFENFQVCKSVESFEEQRKGLKDTIAYIAQCESSKLFIDNRESTASLLTAITKEAGFKNNSGRLRKAYSMIDYGKLI
ncbi:hypothetical protein [Niallia circulans]|uniref:Uncharacterized protein n=1 Tax=Niallia circulans TaxID=1397 RepID=A0A941G8L0_NIACI|nr:hypothetical protein [Niallia circulans]MCB5235528.1 hypothetical protein [Niallia circulans]